MTSSLIGQVIGNYRLEALLGAGGMGQVYRARHVHLDTVAAVKVMHEHVAYDPTFRASFRDEAKHAHALVHPNIVKIHDFGEQDGRFYLVMELVTDGSLRVLLQGLAKLPLSLALDLVSQAAEGLAFAQARGMVHRDLKPDNLLLSREGRTGRQEYVVKISDFGLAKLAEGGVATSAGAQVGTPAYMSPEQCQGLPLDGRSDLYSLGVVLYEATTRYLPFEIHTPTDAVYKHVFTPPPPPRSVCPDLPVAVEAIILRCLAKSPEARYRDATDLAGALQAVLAEIDQPVAVGGPLPGPYVTVVTAPPPVVGNRIAVTLPERTLTITPGQPVTFAVTIANLGRTVDHFTITVDGVPREWVQVPPAPVQLNPNANTTMRLTISVPRAPSAQAGDHAVTIVATSRDKPEDTGQQSARWTVLPFAALALEIEPVQAAGHDGAQYALVVTNEGNAEDTYTLRGSDDERALTYRFQSDAALEDDNVVRIGSGKIARVALRVGAPRRWIGTTQLRAFQVRATSPTTATGQTVTARLAHRPVVPAWAIPLAALLVVALLALLPVLFRPAVTDVAFDPPAMVPGQPVTVRVTAPRARAIAFVGIARPDAVGPDTFTFPHGLPPDMKELTVRATNLFGSAEERFPVHIPPPTVADARIERFAVDRTEAATGDTVTVSWQVSQADTIELLPFGTVGAAGTQKFTILTTGPAKETYTLVATNSAGRQVRRALEVAVPPPAGPVLPAVIEEFAIVPTKARKGDTVTIRWRISKAKSAMLKPGGAVPLQGERTMEIQQHGPTQLSVELIAVNAEDQPVTQSATVAILEAPAVVIEAFTAEPRTVFEGQQVTVRWRVSNAEVIEVSPFGRVEPEGQRTISAAGAPMMSFVLTASTSGLPPERQRAAVRVQPRPVTICQDAVQGKIAWDYTGNRNWSSANLQRLCRGASTDQPARCFQRVMHEGINWGNSTRWNPQNALDLCEQTLDATRTIACFQRSIAKKIPWSKAIQTCGR